MRLLVIACLLVSVPAHADVTAEADALLTAAGKAPHNGRNPQLEVTDGKLERLRAPLEDAVVHGDCERRRDAASFLSRATGESMHAFWRAQLEHRDLVVRWWAVVKLGDYADAKDFEPVLRQVVAAPALADVLASALRAWKARKAVPALVELLDGPDATGGNAVIALGQMPDVPKLDADLVGPAEHHGTYWTQKRDTVAPYRRWWKQEGAARFKEELAWWMAWKAKLAPDKDLVPDAPCATPPPAR
jgi:hypothetical protein